MGSTLNYAILIGHLGADPEMRYTGEGIARTRLRVATDRPMRTGGEPHTDWHRVVCWGPLAEFAHEYLRKGRLVYVAGRIAYNTFDGQDGQPHQLTEIVAREVTPLDRRPDDDDPVSDDDHSHPGSQDA